MDIFSLGGVILDLLQTVVDFWNDKVSLVFELLGQSPVSFKNGGPWAVVANLEPIFVAVGSSLVVLFFVIGFCSESIDVKEEVRFETILRMLMRIGIAEWLVANNVTIMKAFFTSAGNLVGLMTQGTTTKLKIPGEQQTIIKDLGFGESLLMMILTVEMLCKFADVYNTDPNTILGISSQRMVVMIDKLKSLPTDTSEQLIGTFISVIDNLGVLAGGGK